MFSFLITVKKKTHALHRLEPQLGALSPGRSSQERDIQLLGPSKAPEECTISPEVTCLLGPTQKLYTRATLNLTLKMYLYSTWTRKSMLGRGCVHTLTELIREKNAAELKMSLTYK